MRKLEKMSISEIIDMTHLYLYSQDTRRIWKDETPTIVMQRGIELLEIIDNRGGLVEFVTNFGGYVDKIKFLLAITSSYQRRLMEHITTSERKKIQYGIANARKLLGQIDETYVFFKRDEKTDIIESMIIVNTKEESQGIIRKNRNANIQRLAELREKTSFGNVVQALFRTDIQYTIMSEQHVGTEFRKAIEYNSIAKLIEDDVEALQQLRKVDISELAATKPHAMFIEETIKILEDHIEEADFDKLLLCAARNYIKWAELKAIKGEGVEELRQRLEVIKSCIKRKNVKVPTDTNNDYTISELEQDMKRFIKGKVNSTYITKKECEQIKKALKLGEISLNNLTVDIYNALDLNATDNLAILRANTNNYIFFLRQNSCPHSKIVILRDITDSSQCSRDLLQLLCEKTDITTEEVCNLFDKGIISTGDLRVVRGKVGQIISNKKLFEKYQDYRAKSGDGRDSEAARMELERYALAYRNTEIIGKTKEEVEEKGEEFINEVGEEIQTADLVPLYGLDIIPLKVAVDWGGENIIGHLLSNETLKPADARYLRDKGLLNENVLERLFKDSFNMSYSYQVSLVSTVFNGQTKKEKEIRERLSQYYNIENGLSKHQGKVHKRNNKKIKGRQEEQEVKTRIKMRDPGAKYNLLSAIDKDVRIEEGIIDGHIIFHYPNLEEGMVLIEKLHKITTNKETGLIEIKADNETATYVMSEEEFISMKHQLIQDGRVDRTQLTQKWWVTRDPEHWIPHAGTEGWEKTLKERFELNNKNSRYSTEDLARIEEFIAISIESKKGEDR